MAAQIGTDGVEPLSSEGRSSAAPAVTGLPAAVQQQHGRRGRISVRIGDQANSACADAVNGGRWYPARHLGGIRMPPSTRMVSAFI